MWNLQKPEARSVDRGRSWVASDGVTIRWTDNSPSSAMHKAEYFGERWTQAEFRQLIHDLPASIWERRLPINEMGYYVAHLLPVKPDCASGRLVSKTDRIARFIRNVHPANHFYVPNRTKGTGRRYGEDPSVIASVADRYRDRFSHIWAKRESKV
jgi:hypothetical protein